MRPIAQSQLNGLGVAPLDLASELSGLSINGIKKKKMSRKSQLIIDRQSAICQQEPARRNPARNVKQIKEGELGAVALKKRVFKDISNQKLKPNKPSQDAMNVDEQAVQVYDP